MNEKPHTTATRTLADRYELGEFIGQGGMATVYRGVDTKLGRQVAVKIMKADLADDEEFRERFHREAQNAARMTHPSIVRVYDAGNDLIQTAAGAKQLPFIVMEYVGGRNLRQHLAEGGVSVEEAYRITNSVLTALEYSHRAGIVHRDIKPANIMVTPEGRVKVMDFGIARAVSDTSSSLQQTTQILGTAAYFSPEQAKGETVDTRTDLYATGIMLYEMLTGSVPFKGESAVAVAYQHVSERPRPPRDLRPELSEPLNRVVLHSLIKDKNRRFQSANEFRTALQAAMRGEMPQLGNDDVETMALGPSSATTQAVTERQIARQGARHVETRPPRTWIWLLGCALVTVVAAVALWLIFLSPKEIFASNTRVVPDVVNVERELAIKEIEDLNLVVVTADEPSDTVAVGKVTRTDPVSGTEVTKGDAITVYVSSGPDGHNIPSIEGQQIEDATAQLEELGFVVGTVTERDDPSSPKGLVLEVTPAVGTFIKTGGSVALTVSSGAVDVPDVKGQSLAAARAILNNMGLTVVPKPLECAVTSEDSLSVVEQSIVGKAPQRSSVEIGYCVGTAPAPADGDADSGNN
ncbi:Stk1 family PASTA domain-containing Ser/Thr kinase [Canibacter zhoujuaniae]|uniref:Stk1 family PASTA domain-containing Ser/Thr kinase n=1 Tax=Canibacter zhoujuaniae TaxID=2708343 RepID=UPI001420A2C1|nr:Stk1 family PASTA domain-containing Ser/Thr kinase [Canibacter zhoujuaniae]